MKVRTESFRGRQAGCNERGATLVLFALLITALFVIVALVVDLGFVRQNRQADKSAADFAVSAGIRSMDGGNGRIDVWGGICTAVDYLKANRPELSSLTPVGPDPCPPATIEYCVNSPTDWRSYVGLADGGDVRVTVAAGYDLSASGFAEDADEYSGDLGDDPCEHLAVIIEQRQEPFFGGVAGSSGWETTMRSVARLDVGTEGESVAALVLLERTGCKALEIEGSNARVFVRGVEAAPGLIHADSDGSTCGSTERIIDVETNGAAVPSVVAGVAEDPDPPATDPLPGQILSVALRLNPGSESTLVASDPRNKVCAQVTAADCLTKNPASGALPTANELVRRSPVDRLYLTHIRGLEAVASDYFDLTADQAVAATLDDGVTPLFGAVYSDNSLLAVPCATMPPSVSSSNVWTDCTTVADVDRTFTGSGLVVIAASMTNNNRNVTFPNVAQLFIEGSVNSAGNILVNHGGFATCADRYDDDDDDLVFARTEMVIGGSLVTTGGTLRMCQTTLLMSNNEANDCPIPTAAGTAPIDNSCIGKIDVTGGSTELDWSAPNANDVTSPTDDELEDFEDLAFWTETSSGHKVEGQGGITMAGIFVTPNAAPFRIAGNGTKDTTDAQFFTRRLQVGGQGTLEMSPQPQNAAPIKVIGGYTLVR